MIQKTNKSSSPQRTTPVSKTSSASSTSLVTRADLDKIFNNGKSELSTQDWKIIDAYFAQKGFRDTTDEMLGKTSILIS